MTLQLASGTVVAGFRITRLIDSGATGSVYLAVDRDGTAVALKILAPELADDERFRQRFLRESQLARSLEHPRVVATLASGQQDGHLFLAMVYVDGADLREVLLQAGRLEPQRALHLLGQIAQALDAAHAAGLVHRDVKPANILVTTVLGDESALICDFGLARHVSSVSSLTGERGFAGTIDYVPPEQIQGGGVDGRADVYSLGCVLFECLSGTRPFVRESELAVVYAHLNERPPKLSQLRPEIPVALDHVIQRALAKEPDARYATCGELIDHARAALHGHPIKRTRTRRRALIAGFAVLIAAVAIGITWTLQSSGQAEAASITPTSIAGAQLGLPAAAYEQRFGRPWRFSTQVASRHRILTFPARGIAVYFKGFTDTAVEIITWNPNDRTTEGIGPCSRITRAEARYGRRFKRSPFNTQAGHTYAYLLAKNLIFAANGPPPRPSPTVTAVALFYGDAPDANKSGGALPFAAYLAIDARTKCGHFTATS